ncbi:MAG: MMPL family transporter [Candidatus Thermoplasmatota archaeon]|nr:MMPL family transporter [Candidatus Thermoplasmatota archaeon]
MTVKKSVFEDVPNGISRNAKKIIAIVVLFTLVMGYFASNLDMEADKSSFYPDTEKTENLDEIESSFGATEGKVQVVTVADDGNVLGTEVLNDTLDMKKGFRDNETVNSTLISSNEVPDGMITLADLILKADRAFEVEETIMEHSNETEDGIKVLQNQTDMYLKLNKSLSLGNILLNKVPFPPIHENATTSYKGMSVIVSEPERWKVVKQNRQEFNGLIKTLTDDNKTLDEKITFTEDLILKLQKDEFYGYESFVNLLKGTKNILQHSKFFPKDKREQISQVAIGMTVRFLSIPESMPEEGTEMELSSEFPSLTMNESEKRDRLEEMKDPKVKETVHDVVDYDPEPLNESVNETLSNLDVMRENINESIEALEDLNYTVGNVSIENNTSLNRSVSRFRDVIKRNKTVLKEKSRFIDDTKPKLRSAHKLGDRFQELEKGITKMLSRDFDEDDDPSDLSAKSALSVVQMNSSLGKDRRLEAQKELIEIAEDESEYSSVKVSANQVMMDQVNDSAQESLYVLLPIAFLYVIVVLVLVYRTIIESLVSLLSLIIAVVWTFGAGVLLNYQFNPLIIAVPILMTGLAIDYGIHMIMRIREEKGKGKSIDRSVVMGILSVGGAIFLVTITTAVGFSSTTLSSLEVMRNFGVLATVGVLSSFFLFVIFLPAVIQEVERWRVDKNEKEEKEETSTKKEDGEDENFITRLLSSSTVLSNRYPKLVLLVVMLITIASAYGALQVETTFEMQDFLPEESSQSQNIEYIEDNFDVNQTDVYVLMKGDITDPAFLHALNETQNNMEDDEMVVPDDGLSSPLTVIQRFGTASPLNPDNNETIVSEFDESDIDNDEIPERNITNLYDLLFDAPESRDAIENVLKRNPEGGYDPASAILQVKEDSDKMEDLDNSEVMEEELLEDSTPLREEGYTTDVTSSSLIDQETIKDLSSTQIRSLILAIIIVAIFLTLVFYYLHRSLMLGVITTFPVSLVTLWLLGLIYLVNIPLNFMTITVTALTVGLGVDYSIHVTHRFIEEREDKDRLYDAMHKTILHIGSAHLGALFTTVGALGILATSDILPLSQFGYITAIAIVFSFIASVFVLPSALTLWARYGDKKRTS